jgi:hypothetical protein
MKSEAHNERLQPTRRRVGFTVSCVGEPLSAARPGPQPNHVDEIDRVYRIVAA